MVGPCFLCTTQFLVLQSSRWERKMAGCFTFIAFLYHFDSQCSLCVFIMVLWVGLQCVIVAFCSHTQLLFNVI